MPGGAYEFIIDGQHRLKLPPRLAALLQVLIQPEGPSTDALVPNTAAGRFECPHCHEFQDYSTNDFIPGEGRIMPSREVE